MKLTRTGIKDSAFVNQTSITLPPYDVDAVSKKAVIAPRWAHLGIGNIFRIFLGSIADDLLQKGELDRGLTCLETFDYEVVDKIYQPYDNLALSVILKGDGTRELRVLGSLAESVKVSPSFEEGWKRTKAVFQSRDLQLVSFTITEKGYALKNAAGEYFPFIQMDIENGPEHCTSAMAIVTSGLYARFCDGQTPLSLVSMDNCSQNGSLLRTSVITMAEEWLKRGFVSGDFLAYLKDESKIAFPWTMIDKITPRPSVEIANDLEALGLENMQPVITEKRTYIAPFINAEKPQYLVIEDRFPNGRPDFSKSHGVYLTNRETVNKSERMKVTALLNPVHSALGPLQVVLGIDLFAEGLKKPALLKMGKTLCYQEAMPMIEDPVILSPKAFADELFEDRFPNEYLGDTNLRLSTDVSQGVGVRFGETLKSYVRTGTSTDSLTALPLGIAGWLRYMMGVDDQGQPYELAPDPMNDYFIEKFRSLSYEDPSSLTDQLTEILSNENVFFINLYKAGIGHRIEDMFREMISGKGSVRKTLERYFG